MARALVTGGGGFTGRYVVEQLVERGDQVTTFARGAYPELEQMGVTVLRGNLEDADAVMRACAGIDIVYHVAAKAGYWGFWETFYGPNVRGSENILAACQANGVGRLVYTSSPGVIFDGQPQHNIDESCPYPARYDSRYAHTKSIAEQKILAANGAGGLRTVALRPHFIWGPRDNHILPGLIARARSGKLTRIGDGTCKHDMAYVEDVAYAHLLAGDALLQPNSPVAGSAYFISQGEPVVYWDWVNELLRGLGLPEVRRGIPLAMARAVGAVFETVYARLPLKGEPLLTPFLVNQLGLSQYYSIERARRDFGYQPRYTMAQAMEKTLAYLRQEMRQP